MMALISLALLLVGLIVTSAGEVSGPVGSCRVLDFNLTLKSSQLQSRKSSRRPAVDAHTDSSVGRVLDVSWTCVDTAHTSVHAVT